MAVAVPVLVLRVALVGRDQLGQHPGERVDLVLAELSPGSRGREVSSRAPARARAGSQSEPSSGARGSFRPASELRQGLVERRAAGRTRGQRDSPALRRGGGTALQPIPARGARRPAKPSVASDVGVGFSIASDISAARIACAAFLRSGAPVLLTGSVRAALSAAYPNVVLFGGLFWIDARLGTAARPGTGALRGRGGAPPRRSGPATAAVDPDGKRGRRSGAVRADGSTAMARSGSPGLRSVTARAGSTLRPGSWGRPIGAIKSRILAGDWDGAAADARWATRGRRG